MEEKKKVFIRGLKGRGNEVIDILTKLGAINTVSRYNDNGDYIYFINHRNEISCALIDSEVGAIVMDNYKEIELTPLPWKNGDILIDDSEPKSYAVFKEYKEFHAFRAYFVLNNKTAYFDTPANVGHYHLASEEEIKNLPPLFSLLMGALNEVGLCLPKEVGKSNNSL